MTFISFIFSFSYFSQPDVLPLTSQRRDKTDEGTDERDAVESRSIESTLKRKPSVARMTFDGVAYVVSVSEETLKEFFRRL